MNNPKISVITVVRNGAEVIEQTMLSVLNQTYGNIEYIVVDGASSDDTFGVITNYELRIKNGEFPNVAFRCVSERDGGVYDAMNKGLAMATGEWVNFMNVGDSFDNDEILEKVCQSKDSGADVLYGDVMMHYRDTSANLPPRPLSQDDTMPFCHQAAFVKRSLAQRWPFDTRYKICADRAFFHKLYRSQCKFQYLPFTICNYEAEQGLSSRQDLRPLAEWACIKNNISTRTTCWWQVSYIYFITTISTKNLLKKYLPSGLVRQVKKIKN